MNLTNSEQEDLSSSEAFSSMFLAAFDNGKVQSVFLDHTDPTAVANIKRGIAALFQVTPKGP